ncbi:MAG: sugar phosphate nucleotidyltransferase [Ignavibacteria bacterium]|nr:sugar phosphate nucleotidyltransferase [Ignavibacteria bacterium]
MKGMILAAGYGTRLKPITDKIPKALVKYRSKPLIQYQIERLKSVGINDIVVNTHHFAELIKKYLESISKKYCTNFTIIYEPIILGTGGGILNASNFLKESDFSIICNVDVYSDFDLLKMIDFHINQNPLVTLLVQRRKTSKYLLFDNKMKLLNRAEKSFLNENCYAFNGIHIISKKFFEMDFQVKYCDIIDIYLDLIKKGFTILGFDAGASVFKDLGKLETINR